MISVTVCGEGVGIDREQHPVCLGRIQIQDSNCDFKYNLEDFEWRGGGDDDDDEQNVTRILITCLIERFVIFIRI